MKYKIGDKVQIKSLDWYNRYKDINGNVNYFAYGMSEYCGRIAIITGITYNRYNIDIDNNKYVWDDYMFENIKVKEIILPNGWEVDKIEEGKITLKESNKNLPKTWEECSKLFNHKEYTREYGDIINCISLTNLFSNVLPVGLRKPLLALCQLLVCREIYRDGWKPDWKEHKVKYVILIRSNEIARGEYENAKCTLSFQSEEVRDKFLENFKDLIEEAKELI